MTVINKDQAVGEAVNQVNIIRWLSEQSALETQQYHFEKAINEVEKVKSFVGSPENIIGNSATKHGEIAEQVEVGIRNAKSLVEGGEKVATFEEVGRTAPVDYRLDDIDVQSKFLNGANNTLGKGVLSHLDKYPDFAADGRSFYHIPKDQHEIIEKILKGEHVEGVSEKTISAIKRHVEEIEARTGRDFGDIVRPSTSNYSDVQQGKIHETLEKHENDLEQRNEEKVEEIKEEHEPNLSDGLKATLISAGVGAAISFTAGLYKHYQEGKNVFKGELSPEDWKALGLDTAKGAAIGGLTGAAVYALTNFASLSAPFAAAVVSSIKSLASLYSDFENGQLTLDEFIADGLLICSESALVAIATTIGQALIPVPGLGAVLGSVAGQMMLNFLKDKDSKTSAQLRKEMESFMDNLDTQTKAAVNNINEEFKRLGDLTKAAFDFELNSNLVFNNSITLARAYGVPEKTILKNRQEIDDYFLS